MTREELAKQQEALVAALVAGGPPPAGFDSLALQATAVALLNKRAGEVAHRAPDLTYQLGAEFAARFREWASSRPKTTTAADTVSFRDHLISEGIIPPPEKSRRSLRRLLRLRLRGH
ncbi:hypothetical protein [Smaragdicoccus niigatensis]|uniref:hypothetical protein n=1 Tax=Smaragdicoccus niigatensis TaxID=359359 RepID=UPI000381CC07|nr:hypothetical protein [Smaragdicoccus niigatensis]